MDGQKYTADNVEQQVLNENYLRFATIEGDRTKRVELQSALAKAIFEAVMARNSSRHSRDENDKQSN